MRRRLMWIIPAAVIVTACVIAFWPMPDGYDFLRALGAIETIDHNNGNAVYPMGVGEPDVIRIFTFFMTPPLGVESI